MYDLIDRPVTDLPAFERAVLDATRRWVHALTVAGTAPASEAHDPFDAAMRALDRGSADDLVIERPCHSTVGETEAVILGLWRLVRADRLRAAQAVAQALVAPVHARAMIGAIARVAANGHP